MTLSYRPFCPFDSRQAGFWYLPAGWRDTTSRSRFSEKATGELIDTETVTISSEEGRWKRAERYLADGLSYCLSGVGRARRKPTL